MPLTADLSPLAKAISSYGNPVLTASEKKFGEKSLYIDGSSFIIASSDTGFQLGTKDFTIECWFNAVSLIGVQTLLSTAHTTDYQGFLLGLNNNQVFWLLGDGSDWLFQRSAGSVSLNAWYHVAISREGNTARLFLNGTLIDSITNSTNLTNTNNKLVVGGRTMGNQFFHGYIDEVRITKGEGTARYTSSFSPPTLGFPALGTPITAPTIVRNLTASASSSDSSIDIGWGVPLDDNGGDITDYKIQYSNNSGASWIDFNHAASTSTTITISGLSFGSYLVRVGAINIAGVGEYATTIQPLVLATITTTVEPTTTTTVEPTTTTTVSPTTTTTVEPTTTTTVEPTTTTTVEPTTTTTVEPTTPALTAENGDILTTEDDQPILF